MKPFAVCTKSDASDFAQPSTLPSPDYRLYTGWCAKFLNDLSIQNRNALNVLENPISHVYHMW